MIKGGQPSTYVVDSHATWPPPVPRLSQKRHRVGVAQTLLFLLVSMALCGMAIEACFIYRLYMQKSETSASSSKQTAGKDVTSPTESPRLEILPSKPVAHLTDGQDVVHGNHIMAWSMDAKPLCHEIFYNDGHLIIQKPGYYYVYSKIYFLDSGTFYHSVNLKTKLYIGNSIPLLTSRKYSPESQVIRSNSFLGGVFLFHVDDAIFVKVSNTSKIMRHNSFENIFGAYMI